MPELLRYIEQRDLPPEAIITHRTALEDAAKGWELFELELDDCRKVVRIP